MHPLRTAAATDNSDQSVAIKNVAIQAPTGMSRLRVNRVAGFGSSQADYVKKKPTDEGTSTASQRMSLTPIESNGLPFLTNFETQRIRSAGAFPGL